MNKLVKNFLEFEGKTLLFKSVDGTLWIAIKPICELIGVDHSAQLKSIKRDPILGSAWSVQTIQVPSDQPRNMVCMAEKFIYGWLFNIQSDSPDLLIYKWKVYEILFDYFQGSISGRNQLLEEKTRDKLRIEQIENSLMEDERFQEYMALKCGLNYHNKKLRDFDRRIITQQLSLWMENI
jgi:hypothetical protein